MIQRLGFGSVFPWSHEWVPAESHQWNSCWLNFFFLAPHVALSLTLAYVTVVGSISWWPTTSQRWNPVNISSMSVNRQARWAYWEQTNHRGEGASLFLDFFFFRLKKYRKLHNEVQRIGCLKRLSTTNSEKTEWCWPAAAAAVAFLCRMLIIACMSIRCWDGTRQHANLCYVAFTPKWNHTVTDPLRISIHQDSDATASDWEHFHLVYSEIFCRWGIDFSLWFGN